MPRTRTSKNAGKVISLDDDSEPQSAAAAVGRAIRSKATAPAPEPVPKPAPKPRRASKASKGKDKVVTIEDTNAQIENNQNLASETQADYVRQTNFIAKCLKATDMQKLINQPDKVINYIAIRT
jgi:hypothetical protein